MSYQVLITRRAKKDVDALSPKLKAKLRDILTNVVAIEPHRGKRLVGDLAGYYSLRLSLKDRIVYSIDEAQRIVFIARARSHYGD